MKEFLAKLKSIPLKDKIILLACIAVLGILLIGFPSVNTKNRDSPSSSQEYKSQLETQLSDTLAEIEGVGKNTVMITLSGEIEQSTGSYSKGASVSEYPKITGVLIVAEGAADMEIRSQITLAASKALGIGANKISVLSSGSKQEGK